MNNKKLREDRVRIIKIGKDALWEFIYESMIDNLEPFFDIADATKELSSHDIDFETGDYICLIKKVPTPLTL